MTVPRAKPSLVVTGLARQHKRLRAGTPPPSRTGPETPDHQEVLPIMVPKTSDISREGVTQTPDDVRVFLALSDERDQWSRYAQQQWLDGYAAAEAAHAGDYSAGYLDGILRRKHAEHDHVEYELLQFLRWGPGGPEHYGDPRPGDFPGGRAIPADYADGEAA